MASIAYSYIDKIRFVPINLSIVCLIEFVVVETGIRLHSYTEVRYVHCLSISEKLNLHIDFCQICKSHNYKSV